MHQIRFLTASAPPDPVVGLRGPTSKGKGRGGKEKEGRGRWEGKGGRGMLALVNSVNLSCFFYFTMR